MISTDWILLDGDATYGDGFYKCAVQILPFSLKVWAEMNVRAHSMNRIDRCFADLKARKKKAFVAYIAAGDPNLEQTARMVDALEKAGVSILELGVPFSDPLADGVVNQLAADRALKAGTTLSGILKMVAGLRKSGCELPLVMFTYFNPIHFYGIERFVKDAARAGVDGVLNLDLPPEEAEVYEKLMQRHGMHSIYLISPTTPSDRIRMIARRAGGFIYYVSREGVTGMRKSMKGGWGGRIEEIRKFSNVPVVIGFGISTPEQAAAAAHVSDGCVVGSAIVNQIGRIGNQTRLTRDVTRFVKRLGARLGMGSLRNP